MIPVIIKEAKNNLILDSLLEAHENIYAIAASLSSFESLNLSPSVSDHLLLRIEKILDRLVHNLFIKEHTTFVPVSVMIVIQAVPRRV